MKADSKLGFNAEMNQTTTSKPPLVAQAAAVASGIRPRPCWAAASAMITDGRATDKSEYVSIISPTSSTIPKLAAPTDEIDTISR